MMRLRIDERTRPGRPTRAGRRLLSAAPSAAITWWNDLGSSLAEGPNDSTLYVLASVWMRVVPGYELAGVRIFMPTRDPSVASRTLRVWVSADLGALGSPVLTQALPTQLGGGWSDHEFDTAVPMDSDVNKYVIGVDIGDGVSAPNYGYEFGRAVQSDAVVSFQGGGFNVNHDSTPNSWNGNDYGLWAGYRAA